MDPIENLAAREAQELKTPAQAPQALQEIHNELHQMAPAQALHFAQALNRDMGGASPLHERPEVAQGQNGQQVRTGNEVLTMADPYHPGQEQVVKQIRHNVPGQPGFVPGQPGAIPGQPGYPGQQALPGRPGAWTNGLDQQGPVRAADHVAQELRTPQLAQQALQEIRNDLLNMRPGEALQFARRLNTDLVGQSPLHERPEMVQGANGQQIRTGNELLTMTDPYGREQVVKQIRRDYLGQPGQPGYAGQNGYPIQQPGYPIQQPGPAYPPGYPAGYDQPVPVYPPVPPVSIGIGLSLPLIVGGFRPHIFPSRRPHW